MLALLNSTAQTRKARIRVSAQNLSAAYHRKNRGERE